MIVPNPLIVLREVFGEKLAGVLVFGSYAREEDVSPGSDLNLAIVLREPATPYERAGAYSSLLGPVSPLIVTLGQLRLLWRQGDFIAHLLHGDSKPLYISEELASIVSVQPPLTGRTLGYLRRHSLAALGVAVEEHLASRWVDSMNYSYRGYRSAVRYVEARRRGVIPFSDREVIASLEGMGVGALEYRRLRALRRLGGGRRESRDALEAAFSGVKGLLGLEGVDMGAVLRGAAERRVGRVRVYEEEGRIVAEIHYVDGRGRLVVKRVV